MQLIWTPTEDCGARPGKTATPEVRDLIEGKSWGYHREWVMEFEVPGGGTYEQMKLYAPNSQDARNMEYTLLKSWGDDKRDPQEGEQHAFPEMVSVTCDGGVRGSHW